MDIFVTHDGGILRPINPECGFFGEIGVEELFGEGNDSSWLTGDQNLDLTEGVDVNSSEPWLKHAWQGKIVFSPKKAIFRSISWDHIYIKGCVYGTGDTISDMEQEMLDTAEPENFDTEDHEHEGLYYGDWLQATIGVSRVPQDAKVMLADGKEYIVRLMRGAGREMSDHTLSDRGAKGPDNEWNRLILPLHEEVRLNNWGAFHGTDYSNYANTRTPDWGVYYDDWDLWTYYNHPDGTQFGARPWMMEMRSDDRRFRAFRGSSGAVFLSASFSWSTSAFIGFRPVLVSL